MKNSLYTIIIATLTLSTASAVEEISWVQTPFWQAPQVKSVELKLKAPMENLTEVCNRYQRLISYFRNSNPTQIQTERINYQRKLPLVETNNWEQPNFSVIFPLELADSDQLSVSVNYKHEMITTVKEKLPYFNQTESSTVFLVQNLENLIPTYKENDSATFISKKIGLEDSVISFVKNEHGAAIKVEGKDVACDLLADKIVLETKVPATVNLKPSSMENLENFYQNKVSPVINKVLITSEASYLKAARLGYKLGLTLESEDTGLSQEEHDKRLLSLLGTLFNVKTFEPSSNLIEYKKKRIVDLKSSAEGLPVSVTLGL